MNKIDLDILLEQIRKIILNKPISKEHKSESEELVDLQDAIYYLSNCLSESNEFLKYLSMGELDVPPPGRHNFLAGGLKELHSGLKHLTWQANQVAQGDYSQTVNFMGEFSDAFNKMIFQLFERENRLKEQSSNLLESNRLMKAIMAGIKDWIVVIDKETRETIYINQPLQDVFCNSKDEEYVCRDSCELMEYLKRHSDDNQDYLIYEFECPSRNRVLSIQSFLIHWNGNLSYAHYISDITDQKETQKEIEDLVYIDELTSLYNRRFCFQKLNELLEQECEFCFCMLDLDGLKFVNDNHGHHEGDQYLKIVAAEMLKITSLSDTVCRLGGDEFAIIIENMGVREVINKAKKLDDNLHVLSKVYPMSASYGVVHIESGTKILAETVIAQADEKMYALKNAKK